jgi:hypothetical protein
VGREPDGKLCLLSLELAANEWSSGREQSLCTRGFDGLCLDSVQKLSLESLTWELMQFSSPIQVVISHAYS